MEFTEAVEKALNGNAVAFTGAGFSAGATNFLDAELPNGRSLADLLFERSGKPGYKGDLDLAATFFLRHRDPSELVTLLRDQYTVKSVTPSHVVLGNVPWRRVYTTNYDLVMENGYGKNDRRATWATLETDVREASGKANVVVHINGCIDLLTQASLRNEFKLTNQSYLTTTFLQSPWCFQFRSDLRLAQAIFFLGYSLYDLDIQKVLFEEEVKDKCFFIVRTICPQTIRSRECSPNSVRSCRSASMDSPRASSRRGRRLFRQSSSRSLLALSAFGSKISRP
jgi:hypothetical protein